MERFDLRLWPDYEAAGGDPSSPALIDQITIDSRQIDSNCALFVALKGTQDGHHFVEHAMQSGAKYALVSNGWVPPQTLKNIQLLQVDCPLAALQSIAESYRKTLKAKVICIAGTYGKTMVKDLLQRLLSARHHVAASPGSFNSQIGVPLSLLTLDSTHEVALIEAAISAKDEMDKLAQMILPDAVILAPIGKKHLATLKDAPTTEKETLKLLNYIKPKGWVLSSQALLKKPRKALELHFWDQKCEILPHAYLTGQEGDIIQPYCIDFPDGAKFQGHIEAGFYYFLNLINMAIKAAWKMGIPSQTMIDAIKQYEPEPIRTEIWKSQQGATFINASYCADAQSIDQALKLYQHVEGERKIFLFSGMRRKLKASGNPETSCKADYRRIGLALNQADIHHLILVGPQSFEPLIREIKSQTLIQHFDSHDAAFSALLPSLSRNDCVLLKGECKLPLERIMQAFNGSPCSNQCTINLDAVKNNISRLRSHLAPHTRLMAMVKAFAYGTGELPIAKFLKSCAIDILGVSTVDEGVALKSAKVPQAIFVLNAAIYEVPRAITWDLEVAVSDKSTIKTFKAEAAKQQRRVKLHLHVDTGMGRFGCRPEEALELAREIACDPFLELEGIMTHFAVADDALEDDFTHQQVTTFDQVIRELETNNLHPKWKHAANSSASLRFNFSQYNMVRVGLALYGLRASQTAPSSLQLQQALSLTSRIVGINTCKAGETISYGRSYIISQDSQRIAMIPLGYFDGLHRKYSNRGHVIIRGVKVPIVGKICMDYLMVDISHVPSAAIGDPVLIFGEDEYGHYLPAEEFATYGDSIVHELITCLGPRIQRIFIHEEKQIVGD